MAETMPINVTLAFGHTIQDDRSEKFTIDVAADGSDTILQVKTKIAVRPGKKSLCVVRGVRTT